MDTTISVSDAFSEDSYGITQVRRNTWLATYPSAKEGITKEDKKRKKE